MFGTFDKPAVSTQAVPPFYEDITTGADPQRTIPSSFVGPLVGVDQFDDNDVAAWTEARQMSFNSLISVFEFWIGRPILFARGSVDLAAIAICGHERVGVSISIPPGVLGAIAKCDPNKFRVRQISILLLAQPFFERDPPFRRNLAFAR